MLIELITPLLIATAPATVIIQDTDKYSHETQAVERAEGSGLNATTFGGTRTYDSSGKPFDNDND